jgi:hypothetical protein
MKAMRMSLKLILFVERTASIHVTPQRAAMQRTANTFHAKAQRSEGAKNSQQPFALISLIYSHISQKILMNQ